jgi:hypothetical protein
MNQSPHGRSCHQCTRRWTAQRTVPTIAPVTTDAQILIALREAENGGPALTRGDRGNALGGGGGDLDRGGFGHWQQIGTKKATGNDRWP